MIIEAIGSILPDEVLITARRDFERGIIDRESLVAIEDEAVRRIVERQIACGLPFVTSGELRRKHWAKDFWFGLNGISCEHISTGRLYQPVESATDLIHLIGRIGFNPDHPFFDDFRFLYDTVAQRAGCRQSLPSPADLLLEIYALSNGHPEKLYSSPDTLIDDIAESYRLTALKLHELGCDSLQYDDTALGLMCDDNYTKCLLQGGVDLLKLHGELLRVINDSLDGIPEGMEKAIYLSGGDKIVPEWEYVNYPDNIMPDALATLNVDKFFIPLDLGNDYAIEVMRHIPDGKAVVIGLADAHSPLQDNPVSVRSVVSKVGRFIDSSRLAISTRTGFKLASYSERALIYEDQWRKLRELAAV